MTTTTIQVNIETRDELAKIGTYEDTMDDIINRLISEHKRNNGGKPNGKRE
jgi:predicted CopG family antitoxin